MRFQRLISGILIFSLIPLLAVAFPSTTPANADLPAINVKNAASLKQIAILDTGNKEDKLWQQALEWTPDGNTIAAINDKGIWLFDINDLHSPPKLLAEKNVCCIEFNDDGSSLLSMSDQLANKIWDMKTKQAEALDIKIGPFGEAQFSPNGKYLASWDDQSLFVWDLKANKQVAHLSGVTWPFRFNHDSTFLVARDQFYNNVFKIYNIATGEEQAFSAPEKDKSQVISAAIFSPDSKLIAIGSRSTHLWLWDLKQEKNIADLEADYFTGVLGIVFSPDGKTLAAWGETKMYLWDLPTGTKRNLEGFGYDHIGANFSPDSKLLATWDNGEAGYNQVGLWDVSSGAQLNSFSHQWPFKFNPQGTRLASINDDGQIVIWGAAK